METAQEEFQIRVYLKTELAQLYAPHLDPEAALRKMRKWIHRNPDLYRELYAGTEGKNEQAYSKRQVAEVSGGPISTEASLSEISTLLYTRRRVRTFYLILKKACNRG